MYEMWLCKMSNNVSDEDIAKVEHILNTRARASLGYKTPNEVFLEYLQAA